MNTNQSHTRSLALLSSLFFSFGFLTCMNDVLVPHLKSLFTLSYTEATLIQFAFFSSYFVVSIPSSRFCEKVGYSKGLMTGLTIAAFGAFGFLGSANFHSFGLFLGSFFVLAAGITLIQVAANPYVTLLGAPETSSMRLNLVQALNSLGTTVAPYVGAKLILSNESITSVEKPYFAIGILLLGLAGMVFFAKFPTVKSEGVKDDATWSEMLANKKLRLGMLGIFTYVGAEVAIGTFMISFLSEGISVGLDKATAAHYVSYYWGGAMVGRFLGTYFLMKFNAPRVLQYFVSGAILMVTGSLLTDGWTAGMLLIGVGLCNSIMFPTIFSQSITGLKRGTEKASGLLCMAIVGGALVPPAQGWMADSVSLRASFVIPLVCYIYLWVFSGVLAKKGEKQTTFDPAGSLA